LGNKINSETKDITEIRRRELEKSVSKKVGRAIADYDMIRDGDRVLVAVSGGKDSLVLLKILSDRTAFVPIKYEVTALHVDLGYKCVNKDVLREFLKAKGLELRIKKIDILKGKSRAEISCFWCSWNRRKALFEAAKELGCNKIAFGHHKDDIVQTILMNLLFEGQISAMVPKQEVFGGKVSLIRPLAYVEETETEEFARLFGFPVPHCACPNGKTSKRAVVRDFINQLQSVCPSVKTNVFKSLQRIKKDYLL
jgi:tRNA 2-thiocytidine biosynthesis protein TtcA